LDIREASNHERAVPDYRLVVRILQVITDTDRRGAQVFATDLAVSLRAKGHSVQTVALATGSQRPKLEVEVLGSRPRGLTTLFELRRRMASVDVTIAHGSATALACAIAGGRRRPWVYRQISDTRFWAATPVRRVRVSLYLRRAVAVVALSKAAKSDLVEHLKVAADSIHVVPNGVPIGSFAPATDDERRDARRLLHLPETGTMALFIGALVPEKGAEVAIGAMTHAPSARLAIAGGGPEVDRLTDLAERLPGRVFMLGILSDASIAYAASDVVVLPSLGGDSMPATLIEAAFCGLPSIATPIGSIRDIVIDGETGTIVAPGDDEALGAVIERMATSPELRRELGEAARDRCRRFFEIDVVADGWLEVLERSRPRMAVSVSAER
jgi:glycosyltransferase involved in cell wall biosynthesis